VIAEAADLGEPDSVSCCPARAERECRFSSPASSDLCAKRQGSDINGRELELEAGHLAQHVGRVQLVRARPLKNRREPIGRLVEDLGYLQYFLSASHQLDEVVS
jgi:hypothetical protein